MKIRYKNWMANNWKTTTSMKELAKAISKLSYSASDVIEVKLACPHKKTFIESGIETCVKCGEQLRVTSWRD